jgi:hypothetical protein
MLDAPPSRGRTSRAKTFPRSKSPPSDLKQRPSSSEGAGNAGRFNRTHSLREKKTRNSRRRFAENVPAFPARMVLTVSFVLAPETGLSCLRRLVRCVSIVTKLDISVGISGPHDFAVRLLVHSSRAPKASTASRTQRFVTIAKRPSYRGGTREQVPVICPTSQAQAPATRWHDGQISLRKRLKVKTWMRGPSPRMTVKVHRRHCEEQCDEAIQIVPQARFLDCFASARNDGPSNPAHLAHVLPLLRRHRLHRQP